MDDLSKIDIKGTPKPALKIFSGYQLKFSQTLLFLDEVGGRFKAGKRVYYLGHISGTIVA